MPDKKIDYYLPYWNGEAWVPVKVVATMLEAGKVPEGEPMISTKAASKTAPERMQPDPAA